MILLTVVIANVTLLNACLHAIINYWFFCLKVFCLEFVTIQFVSNSNTILFKFNLNSLSCPCIFLCATERRIKLYIWKWTCKFIIIYIRHKSLWANSSPSALVRPGVWDRVARVFLAPCLCMWWGSILSRQTCSGIFLAFGSSAAMSRWILAIISPQRWTSKTIEDCGCCVEKRELPSPFSQSMSSSAVDHLLEYLLSVSDFRLDLDSRSELLRECLDCDGSGGPCECPAGICVREASDAPCDTPLSFILLFLPGASSCFNRARKAQAYDSPSSYCKEKTQCSP